MIRIGPDLVGLVEVWVDIDTAEHPVHGVWEDENDVCFNTGYVAWTGKPTTVHCEITNAVLHVDWRSGFDWRFKSAKSKYVEGWVVTDEGHDEDKTVEEKLELHPLKEVRFSVPSEGDVEYRCLFMDTSGRFHNHIQTYVST